MDDKEINKLKEELMKPAYTEDLHHALKELDLEDAKKIVESMTKSEVYSKVNNRRFQGDYIAAYIEYLWEISEPTYWEHVKISLDVEVGILWGDSMLHLKKMCTIKIPSDVLKAVFDFAIYCDEKVEQDIEAIGCVIKAQADKFNRLSEIEKYIELLDKDKQPLAKKRINEMIDRRCNYTF